METELKFQVPRASRAGLHAAVATATAQTTRLQAVYVETSGRHLAAAGLALRMRLEGERWVQTLKGRGDGVMSRLEHEVELPRQRGVPKLDIQRHAGTPAGERLAAALPPGVALQTLYRTDIRRLHRRVRSAGAVIELAYDRGWLLAGEGASARRQAVDEIEFELISGPPAALAAFASRWVQRHGLWWDCRTKSEQGMRLALQRSHVPATTVADLPSPLAHLGDGLAVQTRIQAALAHLLPNLAEWLDGRADTSHRQQADLALRALQVALRAGAESGGAAGGSPAAQALLAATRWPTAEQAARVDWWGSAPAQRLLLGSLACSLIQP